ncbi:MAG TPA: NADH-quinone oxidoreductase subunit L [Acidimicrobiia bacterium]|nr:NADH-quinone oxidoreductase subunit L [Acidimicrobiia bacterium]
MQGHALLDLVWLIPALPAAGAVVLLVFGKRIGEPIAGWIATSTIGLSFVGAVIAFATLLGRHAQDRQQVRTLWTWFESGNFVVKLGFLVDPLSVTMILFVTGVGTLIHVYSIGYMHGDPRFSRFFAYLNLFAASMLILVLGNSFLVTFLGWEGVGLCSYLLVSFWFERNSAAVAGKKAFVVNRVGDFGFMLGMFLLFSKTGSLNYVGLTSRVTPLSHVTVTAIALLFFLGAAGKSAQFPLHIWLPDAMEGPTPVSALIHAATMVTAGVFLMVRMHILLDLSAATGSLHAGTIVSWIGAITAIGAAAVALKQNDIKRVLAYSTLSQLGYMFIAVGVGAYSAAIFHMVTHAFFKALLFLGSGSVIHGMSDEQDMRRMGGLRKYMPVTAATFIVGWLAIAGVIPFAGFWSKDDILAKAWVHHSYALWAVGVVAALLTAFYMTRQVWLVFYGPERFREPAVVGADAAAAGTAVSSSPESPESSPVHEVADTGGAHDDHGAGHDPHESPNLMLFPLVALAGLSIVGGVIDLPFTKQSIDALDRWLAPVLVGGRSLEVHSFGTGFALSTIALVIAVVGIVIGHAVYRNGLTREGDDPIDASLGPLARIFANAYYFDIGISRLVSGPLTAFAKFLAEGFDKRIIDGAVNGIGSAFKAGAGGLRTVQTGLVRNYALGIAAGLALLLIFFGLRVGL